MGIWGLALGALSGVQHGSIVGAILCLSVGVLHGWALAVAHAYDLSSWRGLSVYVIDHTWSGVNTLAGAMFLLVALALGSRLDLAATRGSNRIGMAEGVLPGYATTIGIVQAGTGRRVDRHEAVHILQARIFGPAYLPLVVAGYVLATVLPYWLIYHDRRSQPITGFGAYFHRGVYPHTWHEEWAYRVQGTPPS
jgi:hypothetical protein